MIITGGGRASAGAPGAVGLPRRQRARRRENSYDAELYSEEARAADRTAAEAAGMPGFLVIDPYAEWIRGADAGPG
jgi:hypothetical protein